MYDLCSVRAKHDGTYLKKHIDCCEKIRIKLTYKLDLMDLNPTKKNQTYFIVKAETRRIRSLPTVKNC